MKKLIYILLILLAVFIGLWISNVFGDDTGESPIKSAPVVKYIEIRCIQCDMCKGSFQIFHKVADNRFCDRCYKILKQQAIEFIYNDYYSQNDR